MKQLPGFMMRHTVYLEPFIGTNAAGEVFGVKTPVKCHYAEKIQMVRNAQGEEVSSSSSYITTPDHRPAENSRVLTPTGVKAKVVAVENNTWPGMDVPANSKVYLV
jgi:hypothetical protein